LFQRHRPRPGRRLRDAGHEVWATARKLDDVDTLLAAGFAARQLDVNDSEALNSLADELEDQHGGLDILNNAGYGAMGPLLDGGVEAMRQQFETNVFALVRTRALFPVLRRRVGWW
jgi:NADP-dependent 3-hydroxy acid dehydrogenase YdfG